MYSLDSSCFYNINQWKIIKKTNQRQLSIIFTRESHTTSANNFKTYIVDKIDQINFTNGTIEIGDRVYLVDVTSLDNNTRSDLKKYNVIGHTTRIYGAAPKFSILRWIKDLIRCF
jgi:hypothetical protein